MKIIKINPNDYSDVDPFTHIEGIYRRNPQDSWIVDFGSVPNILLQEWKFADEFWKIFKGLTAGRPICVSKKKYTLDHKDENPHLLIYRIFGYISFMCQNPGTVYDVEVLEDRVVVTFKDIFEVS